MQLRPSFVDELLQRPLPSLTPAGLSDTRNPPFNPKYQNLIADLRCHPLLESALHLMNDDLFSAHFILRRMQQDPWGKWLHAMLHQAEGDLENNAKLWYQEVDPDVLRCFWGRFDPDDPNVAAIDNMYKIIEARTGKSAGEEGVRKTKWEELVCVMKHLEREHGWREVDGTEVYTKDNQHKSRVLGEGYRVFG